MGVNSFERKKKIKIMNMNMANRCFDYLRRKGEIICRKEHKFVVIRLEIRTEDWFTSTLRLWPMARKGKSLRVGFQVLYLNILIVDLMRSIFDF